MRRFTQDALSFYAIVAFTLASCAGGQATEWPRAKAPSRSEKPRMIACPEVGPDYFRVGDSTTCLKISGYVQADYMYHGGKSK